MEHSSTHPKNLQHCALKFGSTTSQKCGAFGLRHSVEKYPTKERTFTSLRFEPFPRKVWSIAPCCHGAGAELMIYNLQNGLSATMNSGAPKVSKRLFVRSKVVGKNFPWNTKHMMTILDLLFILIQIPFVLKFGVQVPPRRRVDSGHKSSMANGGWGGGALPSFISILDVLLTSVSQGPMYHTCGMPISKNHS